MTQPIKRYLTDPTETTKWIVINTFWSRSSTSQWEDPYQVAEIEHFDTWAEAMEVLDAARPSWLTGERTVSIAAYKHPAYDLDSRYVRYKITLDAIAKPTTHVDDSYNAYSYRLPKDLF